MVEMRLRFDRLTASQHAVYSYISNSSRWLTAYEISLLTDVSVETVRSAMRGLLQRNLARTRKRIHGFENGEREFTRMSIRRVAAMCSAFARRNHSDVTGIEPLAKRLRRILGKSKSLEFAEFLK